mmetsp:Transcript_33005/g.77948  ORF Transcript_33005/g.77948 Transcript_33005/m.77948 type:complete len:202 (-) Transcript_33005:403-1008(-)
MGRINNKAPGLCPVDSESPSSSQEDLKVWNGIEHLDTVLKRFKSLVNFQKGNDALAFPQILAGGEIVHGSIHGVFKENGSENGISSEGRRCHDAGSHLVNGVEHALGSHLVISFLGSQSIGRQCLGGRSTALVEGSQKGSGPVRLALQDFVVHGAECERHSLLFLWFVTRSCSILCKCWGLILRCCCCCCCCCCCQRRCGS